MVRGTASATINITQYQFRQNDVLLLEPGSFLLIHEFSEDALVYYVLFSSSFLEKNTFGSSLAIDSQKWHSPICHISDERAEVFKEMALLMMKASNTTPSMLTTEKMIHIFNLLQVSYTSFLKTQENYKAQPKNRKTEIYREYTKLVLEHYQEWHHVSRYAEAMHLTVPHLCSTIHQVGQYTAGEIISNAILTDAKAQLKITTLPIKEIAASLGFDNVAFFNRFFKMHIGVTPKAYRNE